MLQRIALHAAQQKIALFPELLLGFEATFHSLSLHILKVILFSMIQATICKGPNQADLRHSSFASIHQNSPPALLRSSMSPLLVSLMFQSEFQHLKQPPRNILWKQLSILETKSWQGRNSASFLW